jgi:hypothetical protein
MPQHNFFLLWTGPQPHNLRVILSRKLIYYFKVNNKVLIPERLPFQLYKEGQLFGCLHINESHQFQLLELGLWVRFPSSLAMLISFLNFHIMTSDFLVAAVAHFCCVFNWVFKMTFLHWKTYNSVNIACSSP